MDGNTNNALPTPPAATPFWASLPKGWNSGTTYELGHPATFIPFDANSVPTVYYSIQATNLNKNPTTQPLWWDTTPPVYDSLETYADGAVVDDGNPTPTYYVSLSAGNTGNALNNTTFWLPYDVTAAVEKRYSSLTGWPSQGVILPGDPDGYPTGDNLPRLIRLKASPQPWLPTFAYTAGDLVNYKDNIYLALTSVNLNKIPDQSAADWEVQSKTILWTWGWIIGSASDDFTATVLIKGDALPSTDPCWEFRLGLYSHTTGWPTCGVYHEGRLWLGSPAQNRFDASRSNLAFDFSPTAPDGTVADNNAISYTLNAASDESIHAFASIAEGVLICTSEREWLVSASNLNDPITPTSIQAHPVTDYGTTAREVARLPGGVAFIQSGRRRLMEFRAFVDIASYQSRLNSVDITRKCQHLTVDGIIEACYQRVPQPVIWCLPGGVVESTNTTIDCPPAGVVVTQTNQLARTRLFGVGWARTPDVSYAAPFSTEHGRELQTEVQMLDTSICVQRGQLDTAEYLYQAVTQMDNDALTYMEVLQPVFESSPIDDTFNANGTVKQFGTLSQSYFLDSGVTPAGCQIALDGLSATFYGLYDLAGYTVSFTIRGKYVGDFEIDTDGSINIPFVTGTFEKTDIGLAMDVTMPNATFLPAYFQKFYLDVNGNSGVLNPSTNSEGFYGQFGFAYRRRGQMLRPSVPGANGPSFAKIRRNEKMGVYVDAAQEISIGDTFNTLFPLKLTVPRTDGKEGTVEVAADDFVTGIYRDEVNNDHTFDGNLCWEQTRPVPGAVLAVGGFEDVTDS